ncbi:MAG: 5'/3'-nucleotidase SurE [Verrucomicrobiota bacterium]
MSEVSRTLPKILITNDDGIESVLLSEMVAHLVGKFNIIVVAPADERSFCGRSFTFGRDVRVWEVDELPCQAFAVDGTPSDCVNIALGTLCGETLPDLVIAGPNIGRNTSLGFILGSGTVAGALEGAFWGLPALAVSQSLESNEYAKAIKSMKSLPGEFQQIFSSGLGVIEEAIERLLVEEKVRLRVNSLNLPHHYDSSRSLDPVEVPPVDFQFGAFFQESESGLYHSGNGTRERLTPSEVFTDIDCLIAGRPAWTRLDFGGLFRS